MTQLTREIAEQMTIEDWKNLYMETKNELSEMQAQKEIDLITIKSVRESNMELTRACQSWEKMFERMRSEG